MSDEKAEKRATKAVPRQAPAEGALSGESPFGGEVATIARKHAGLVREQAEQVMETFLGWCARSATTTDEDQFNIMAQIIGEIMASDNMAELLEEKAPLSAKELIQVPLLLHGFEIREGTFEESTIPFYAALTVSKIGGETTRVVTCGGMKVLAKLMAMDKMIGDGTGPDQWPQPFWFTSRETSKGYTVLDIVRPQNVI